MQKERLTAFSDGVIAIIITIMVLELKVPHGADRAALTALAPTFLSYVLSFVYMGIYWNNHHHLLYAAERVNGAVLWANMHLLFWLSLIPFATGWMGDESFRAAADRALRRSAPDAGDAYYVLQTVIIGLHGRDGVLARAVGGDFKGKISPFPYLTAMGLSFAAPWAAQAIYVAVALMWLVPDRRIEHALTP